MKAGTTAGKALGKEYLNLTKSGQDFARELVHSKKPLNETKQGFLDAAQSASKLTLASKAATLGMKALSVAGNMAIGVGIGLAIQAVVSGISKLVTAQQDAINAATEARDAFDSQSDSIRSNVNTLKSMEKEFKSLARGVDDYGNNISLSTEEYSRYKSIVEKIVGISPELITGYDKEGKAIANKNSLIERAIELQNIEYKNRLREITDYNGTKEQAKGSIAGYEKSGQKYSTKLAPQSDLVDTIRGSSPEILALLELEDEWDKFNKRLRGQGSISTFIGQNLDEILEKIKASKDYFGGEMSVDAYDSIIKKADVYAQGVSNFDREMERAAKGFNSHLQLSIQTADGYEQLSDAQKNFLQDYTNGFRITGETTAKDLQNIQQEYVSFAENLAENDVAKDAINELFSLDKSTLSAKNWSQQASELVNQIAEVLKFDDDQLKLTLGITVETNQGEIVDNVDNMVSDISSKLNLSANDIGKLSIDDLKLAYTNLADLGCKSIDELIVKLNELKSVNQSPLTFDLSDISDNLNTFNDDITQVYSSMDILDKAADEFSQSGVITAKTFKSLSDNNLLQYLQFSSDGLTILTDSLLNNEQAVKQKAQADLAAALYADLSNIATRNLTDAQYAAEQASVNSGIAAMTAGEQFAQSATGILTAAEAVNLYNQVSGMDGFDFKAQEQQVAQVIAKYNSASAAIANMRGTTDSASNSFGRMASSAKKAANEVKQAMQSAQSAINSLLTMTMNMIKQRYNDEKDRLQDQMDRLEDRYDAEKDALDEINKEKEDQYKKDREAIEAQRKALKAELDARLEALRVKKEEYYWDKETKENNKTISELTSDLEIAKKDDSLEGLARQKELQDQLAQAEEEWKDKQFDHDIEQQEDALQNEFDLADEKYQNQLDILERLEERRKEAHQAELDRIQDAYESKRDRLEREMRDISDYVSMESNIRGEAIDLMNKKSETLYKQLLEKQNAPLVQKCA